MRKSFWGISFVFTFLCKSKVLYLVYFTFELNTEVRKFYAWQLFVAVARSDELALWWQSKDFNWLWCSSVGNELIFDIFQFFFHFSCFKASADFYSPIIFAQLFCVIIFLALCIFHMHLVINIIWNHKEIPIQFFLALQQMECIDMDKIVVVFADACVGLFNLFCFCYFGKVSSDSFELMSESLYECNWPDLGTSQLKMYFVIMIKNAQTPVYYQGMKMVTLDMETFRKAR